MSKRVFVKFVSEPKNDPIKTIVGLACAAQAINEGHEVSVFSLQQEPEFSNPLTLKSWTKNSVLKSLWFEISWNY